MADVFLSYKREDSAKVRKLVAVLRDHGLDTWWDEDIPPSTPWEATIEAELARAKAVIVCWSPGAVASDNVRSEARVAREDGRLIQIFLKPCEPPLFFGERQGVELFKWRGNADDPRIVRAVEAIRKVAAGERTEAQAPTQSRRRPRLLMTGVIAALLLLVAAGVGWRLLAPAQSNGPQTLAVLPFRALNAGDANLVDAIWDDTRGAISRNPNLRVLGRQTVKALANKQLDPADYRRKVGADYLLDGSVEHEGDQVQLKLSLVQTKDGSEVWSDRIGGKLDDVFAFQQRVANEVEGRIRGRVAPGGGTVPKNIATSGEVYALYAEARAKIRSRGPGVKQALPLLERAVAMDPNYAPAWADFGQVIAMRGDGPFDEVVAKANAAVGRALTLAPNLAHAYAVRGFIASPASEAETDLRKAVALDPNDVEARMWLGNWLVTQNRLKEALKTHSQAVEIEPLWFTSMFNKMDDYARLADRRGLVAELRRAERTGDPYLILRAREHVAWLTGRIAEAARNELEIGQRFPDQSQKIDLAQTLITLGYADKVPGMLNVPQSEAAPYEGKPLPAAELRKRYSDASDFWDDHDTSFIYGRLLPKTGRLAEYVRFYKAAFRNAEEYHAAVAWAGWQWFADMAPNVAANLRAAGENALAQQIVDKDQSILEPLLRNGPANWDMAWRVAELRAVQGRDDEAMMGARRAIDQGWLPNGINFAIDIADEPCFAHLAGRADFQALRRSIIAHMANERRQITPAMLAKAGLS